MIGLYDDAGDRIAHAYNGLVVNDSSYPIASAVMNHRFDAVLEALPRSDGMEAYEPHRLSTVLQVDGTVEGVSVADLHDKIDALNAAFDPVRVTHDDAATYDRGFIPYTFSVPTANTTGYPDGLIPMQLYARSLALPVGRVSKFEGHVARYTLLLQAVDPRRYLQTEDTDTLTGFLTVINNALGTYKSWPTLRLTMSGAGDAAWWINNIEDDYAEALTINLSTLVAGDVIDIDMRRRTITRVSDGSSLMSLYVSGRYVEIMPLAQTIQVKNLSGITSAVLTYRRAFA